MESEPARCASLSELTPTLVRLDIYPSPLIQLIRTAVMSLPP
jgi:hypothetical protein